MAKKTTHRSFPFGGANLHPLLYQINHFFLEEFLVFFESFIERGSLGAMG
jgi:hypothetical protein